MTLDHVAWEAPLLERQPDRALEAYARRKMGLANPAITCFSPVPWLARALVDLHPEFGMLMHLDEHVADLAMLVVSQENSCRFCYAAVRILLWAQGMSRPRIERMEQDLARADLPPRTMAALAFARSQSRSGPAGARAAREALQRAGVGADEMKELAFAVAATDFANRVHTIPAVPVRPLERLPDRLHIRLLRPLLGLIVSRHRYRGQATALHDVPAAPYARLVRACAGLPVAPALARTLSEMWASPHLARRCKLLMLAVIARGLGCAGCEGEVAEALQAEGLPAATLAQILTHLDAPELDPVERLLVPFARDTIWFEPALIQRRARALRDQLTLPQFLEAIGVASLANGLCRMSAVVLDCA